MSIRLLPGLALALVAVLPTYGCAVSAFGGSAASGKSGASSGQESGGQSASAPGNNATQGVGAGASNVGVGGAKVGSASAPVTGTAAATPAGELQNCLQGSLSPAVAPPTASTCYKVDATTCTILLQVQRLVNDERAGPTRDLPSGGRHAMPPLAFDKSWSFIAQQWSTAQSTVGTISHDGFPDARVSAYAREFGTANLSIRGENVAMAIGYDASGIACQLFKMWRASDPHYVNIMGSYQRIGVGAVADGQGNWYGTQIFADN
jgi:uncharacterized protein YkwD